MSATKPSAPTATSPATTTIHGGRWASQAARPPPIGRVMPTPTRVGRSEDNPRSPATGDGSGAALLAQGHLVGRARGIAQPPARKHLGVRRQPMRIQPRGAEDVTHVLPPSDQRVGDQLAVTAPGHGFRTQDRRGSGPRELPQPPQRLLELRRLHVVRVAAEAGAAPRGVGRVPSRRPAPTELGFVMVGDADRFERGGERIAGEVRVATRGTSELDDASSEEDCMTEKEQFLTQLEKELPTTMRVLKAYPAAKADLKPHAKCKSARELAWMFVTEQKASEQALDGGIEFGKMPKAPATLTEVVAVYEQSSKAFVDRIRKTPNTELNKTVKFFVAPKQMGDVRKMDLLWFMLMDQVHHRGQFSIYLRMADGKVPSIYGPSADEPWM